MRRNLVVSYDISDPKRLRETYKVMRGFGDHIQLSVFRCELNARERIELRAALRDVIHTKEDQVLFIDLGPSDGRSKKAITALGRPYAHATRHAVVV